MHCILYENCDGHWIIADTLMDTRRAQIARHKGGLMCFWPVSRSKQEWFNCVFLLAYTRRTNALLFRAGVSVFELRGLAATCTPSTLLYKWCTCQLCAQPAKDDNISRDKDTPDWQKLISVYTHTGYVHPLRVPWNILSANEIEKSFL